MKSMNIKRDKRGLVFGPYAAAALLGLLTYALIAFVGNPLPTPQEIGSIQAELIKNIGTAEAQHYYQEKLAEQSTTETLYSLSKTSGLSQEQIRQCDRGDGIYVYNEQCNPTKAIQENFLKNFKLIHDEKLKKQSISITSYSLEHNTLIGTYRIIGITGAQQSYNIQNKLTTEKTPGKILTAPPTYPECSPGTSRDQCYNKLISEIAQRYGMDPLMIKSIIKVESAFNSTAKSSAGALGLMQLVPSSAIADLKDTRYSAGKYCNARGLKEEIINDPNLLNGDNPSIFTPAVNIELGTCYYAFLYDHFNGDHQLALIAYNQGVGATERAQGNPTNAETTDYINKVLTVYHASENKDLTFITLTNPTLPSKITGRAVEEVKEQAPSKIIGNIYVDYSFNVSVRGTLDDYKNIYETTQEKGNCLLGDNPQSCYHNEHGYTWKVTMREGYPLITVITSTRDPLHPSREPVTITFYADPQWLKNPNP